MTSPRQNGHDDEHNDSSTNERILWVHWGKSGGGPRFLYELTKGDLDSAPPNGDCGRTNISFNPDAEIAAKFDGLNIPAFPVPTYHSKVGVVTNLPRLALYSIRLRRWIRKNRIEKVVSVMESVYQSISVPLVLPKKTQYVSCIHDGNHHPGESALVQRLGRRLELHRADQIVVFSEAVAKIMKTQTRKTIILGSHPPFGIDQNSEVNPKSLPADRPIKIGLFGRLQQYKGVDLLLEAAKILREDANTPPFEVHIIGNGPAEESRNGANGNQAIWDVRWIPEDEVDGIIDSLDLLALPYLEASQSGPVTLALAHAVPCVVTPQGALPEQVKGFGAVSAETTAHSFASALREAMNEATYNELSRNAVKTLEDGMSWKQLATIIRDHPTAESAEAK